MISSDDSPPHPGGGPRADGGCGAGGGDLPARRVPAAAARSRGMRCLRRLLPLRGWRTVSHRARRRC